jgi:fatty acid synthase
LALELANMLQRFNIKGQLISVDGAPDYFKHAAYRKYAVDIAKHQSDFLIKLLKMAYPKMEFNVSDLLEDTTDSVQKLDKVLQQIPTKEGDYLTKISNGIITRLKFGNDYDDSSLRKIDAQITLIRASELREIDIDEAYGLNKNTLKKVTVKYIEGNHHTMLENKQLPQIINEIFLE